MTREEETKEAIEKIKKDYMVKTQEFNILKEIALSLAIIADVLKGDKK